MRKRFRLPGIPIRFNLRKGQEPVRQGRRSSGRTYFGKFARQRF
jgi:hypothetical protein